MVRGAIQYADDRRHAANATIAWREPPRVRLHAARHLRQLVVVSAIFGQLRSGRHCISRGSPAHGCELPSQALGVAWSRSQKRGVVISGNQVRIIMLIFSDESPTSRIDAIERGRKRRPRKIDERPALTEKRSANGHVLP
jgi:hypothetical protein